ncbi:hypothetical protein ACTWP5_10315 [Streptomyces sp. 4N509B]|uniref:hypothetical protein n=1 Tax=Streptomyces sp. 4N509B TaxID=3457413 RepID=UPI003FD4C993
MNEETRAEVSIPRPRSETVPRPDALSHPREVAPGDDPFLRPEWVPAQGHARRRAGVHFDALCVRGSLGEEVMSALMSRQGWASGPIIHAMTSGEMTFVLPAGAARTTRWPTGGGLRVLPASPEDRSSFVAVPALNGATWPLLWCSIPTILAPFVDVAALRDVVRGVVGLG